MNEQFQLSYSTTSELLFGGLPLGVMRPQPEGRPIFEAIRWDEYSLSVLHKECCALRSPVRARAIIIAELAAAEWDVLVQDIFSRTKTRAASDARAATARILHHAFPGLIDRMVAAVFGRERSWAVKSYKLAADQLETSVPFREKYDRVQAAALARLWPQDEPKQLTAP